MQLIEDTTDFSAYLLPVENGERVLPASRWRDAVVDAFYAQGSAILPVLPWDKTHGQFQFRQGEVSLWPGINGHGKSLVTSQVALELMQCGERVCMVSLEMKPVKTMQRMTRQAVGERLPTIEFIGSFHKWTDDKLWLYDKQGVVQKERILAVARYCAAELHVRQFFIDSLMKCGIPEDDHDGQNQFVNELCALAQDSSMHVHLVHHSRKLHDEHAPPGKFDAKWSGGITDQVDNVLTVWRNKAKEFKRQQAPASVDDKEPDTLIVVDKQRNGEWEGRISLWFEAESMQFTGSHGEFIKHYGPDREERTGEMVQL